MPRRVIRGPRRFSVAGRGIPITRAPDYGPANREGAPYDVVMTLRVVGAGHGRTGTHSLKLAPERLLGGHCHHMAEVIADRSVTSRCGPPVIRGEEVDWEGSSPVTSPRSTFPGRHSGGSSARRSPTPLSFSLPAPPRTGTVAERRPYSSSTASHHPSATFGGSGSGSAAGSTTPKR
jgi:Sulfotransferase domain